MQADSSFPQRLTLTDHGWRSTLREQPSQDRYLISQSAGEIRLRSRTQAGRIARKSGDRATMIDVVAVGSRQIPVYVPPKSGGGLIDGRPRDIDELGIPLSDCRRKHLGNQCLLRLKVVVEATLRKAGVLHQLAQPDGVHAALSE
jgi:hypothetical protein